jgi:CMP-N-acetylneuraminic acid synthetase
VKALALIPARGGSKGVPGKNVRGLAGKPVIAWTIEAARACPAIERVVVSTDDEEIGRLAEGLGVEVPWLRPAELGQDDTPDFPVFRHALSALASDGYEPEAVAWLRPTAPLRTAEDIGAAVELLASTGAACVRSVCEAEHHPYWMKKLDGDRLAPFVLGADESTYYRRQLLPPVYRLNGAVEVVRPSAVPVDGPLFGGDVRGYVMPAERSIDLETELDFILAEALLSR